MSIIVPPESFSLSFIYIFPQEVVGVESSLGLAGLSLSLSVNVTSQNTSPGLLHLSITELREFAPSNRVSENFARFFLTWISPLFERWPSRSP